jgi:hypothetical protein
VNASIPGTMPTSREAIKLYSISMGQDVSDVNLNTDNMITIRKYFKQVVAQYFKDVDQKEGIAENSPETLKNIDEFCTYVMKERSRSYTGLTLDEIIQKLNEYNLDRFVRVELGSITVANYAFLDLSTAHEADMENRSKYQNVHQAQRLTMKDRTGQDRFKSTTDMAYEPEARHETMQRKNNGNRQRKTKQ